MAKAIFLIKMDFLNPQKKVTIKKIINYREILIHRMALIRYQIPISLRWGYSNRLSKRWYRIFPMVAINSIVTVRRRSIISISERGVYINRPSKRWDSSRLSKS
jgi:hypothetical protein